MDVRMPDGTLIKNVPEGTSQEELLGRFEAGKVQGLIGGEKTPSGFISTDDIKAASSAFFKRIGNAALSVPDAAVTTALNILPSPKNIIDPLLGNTDFSDIEAQKRTLFEDATGQAPPSVGTDVVPLPSAEDIVATGDVVTSLGQTGFQESLDRQAAEAEASPTATAVGNVAGDVATLVAGRGALRAGAPGRAIAAQGPKPVIAPGAKKFVNDVVRSKTVTAFGQGTRKAAEAGLEGATLSILQGGDPMEVAMWSAGAQGAGSMALNLGFTKTGLVGTAVAAAAWLQFGKSITPGGDNFILPSIEEGFSKASWALLMGVGAGALGAGRLRGSVAQNFPKFADGFSAVPRGAVISLINDAVRDEDGNLEAIATTMAEDPDTFTPAEQRRITTVFKDPKRSSLDEVNKMLKIKSFRRKVGGINPLDTVQ